MRIMDYTLIFSIAIKDMGEQLWKRVHIFWPRKGDRQFWAVANFGEPKQHIPNFGIRSSHEFPISRLPRI
jgi:hypothetical protein